MTITERNQTTITIDKSLHTGMKQMARAKRVHVSNLYEQAVEAFLSNENRPQITQKTPENNAKKPENKANASNVPRR
jgi:predicted transcriptional regulator